jgi:hypothetical protein
MSRNSLSRKARIMFLISALVFFGAKEALSARLYVIIMANTLDGAAGEAITAGRNVAMNWLRFFEANLKSKANPNDSYPVTAYVLDGSKFSTQALRQIVNVQMSSIDSSDAIFFYYIGHGENVQGTRYPRLLIPDATNSSQEGLPFQKIFEVLQTKNAGFLLAIAEACNSFPDAGDESFPSLGPFHNQVVDLFFRHNEDVIVTTASPGEFAHASPTKGGIYSAVLFNEIRSEIEKAQFEHRRASWDNIVQNANHPIQVGSERQTPQIWVYK